MSETPGDPRQNPYGEDPTPHGGEEPPGYWEQQQQDSQRAYPPPGYGDQGYPPPGYGAQPYAQDHPRATTVLVLGILGVVLCQVLGPFAWVMGKQAVEEIDASGGRLGGRGAAYAGYVLGIVGTVMLALAVVFFVLAIVLVGFGTMASNQ